MSQLSPTEPGTKERPPATAPLELSWGTLAIVVVLAWLILFDGWRVFTVTIPTPTIFQTATPGQVGVARKEEIANVVVPTSARPLATQTPPNPRSLGEESGIVGVASVDEATATLQPTATAEHCVLTTWVDGSQSCNDGRAIDAAHSIPGYCKPIVWQDSTVSCDDGKPAGNVIWPDPEVLADPTNTPWPAAPTSNVTWAAVDGPDGNTCVTVTFGDSHTQTACSASNVKLDNDDAAFVARMIQDGKVKPGVGAPKG